MKKPQRGQRGQGILVADLVGCCKGSDRHTRGQGSCADLAQPPPATTPRRSRNLKVQLRSTGACILP